MRKLLLFFLIVPFFSCRTLNPNVMFQTGSGFTYATDSTKDKTGEYVIAPEDHLDIRIFTNDALRLAEASQTATNINSQSVYYLVESNGEVKLPLIGRVQVKGLTMPQVETLLEEKYSVYFVSPFIIVRVLNREVLVFQGDGGTGQIINLQRENTTLLEALTQAGGIHSRGKAYKIKLIRGNLKDPLVFQIDLSTMEGAKNSNLIVQSKDIIYVEPSGDYSAKVLTQLTPYIGILTTILLVVNLLKN